MITRFEALGPQATIGDAAELLLSHHAARVPGRRRRGQAARHPDPQRHDPGAVEDRRRRRRSSRRWTATCRRSPAAARLEAALQLLQGRSAPAVGVVDRDGRLVGYITSENIGELMMMETAGRGPRPRRATGPLLPQ